MNDAISGWNDWSAVMSAVADEWSDMNICELQGFITAVVTICKAPSEDEWKLLFENAFVPELPETLLNLVVEEGEDVHDQLQDTDDAYEYQPLLPDDTHDMVERITGIASWANGFLTGYGITSTTPRPDEEELLISLQRLGRLKLTYEELEEAEAEDEGSTEAQYEELLEFARIVPVSMSSMGEFKEVTKLPIIAGLAMQPKLNANENEHAAPIEASMFRPS